ncbi:hypothetical protein D3C76_603540 [compost metagenome]
MFGQQIRPAVEQAFELCQPGFGLLAIMLARVLRVALGIFVQVHLRLEFAVIAGDQCFGLLRGRRVGLQQPVLRVVLAQCPAHDVEAFFQHAGAGIEHRHRALGRQGQQFGGLVLHRHFTDLHVAAGVTQGQACTHGPRATAERVEDHPHTSTSLRPLPWRRTWICTGMRSCISWT